MAWHSGHPTALLGLSVGPRQILASGSTSGLTLSPPLEAVREQVRDAAATGTPLRIVGGGTWLDAGRPLTAVGRVEIAAHRGIVEYVPGDLTLTARGGTTLAEIAAATAEHGQWLALDPFGSASDSGGTIGATVATASAGPAAHAFGTPRDNVLGVEILTGSGALVRGGGRVVKNVAGFDLVRLVVGSWGTLGIVTEATVRLRAVPPVVRTVALPFPTGAERGAQWISALRELPLAAWALEIVSGGLAARIGIGDRPALLARVAGNEAVVNAQAGALAGLAMGSSVRVVEERVWDVLRSAEPARATVIRMSWLPTLLADRLPALLERADAEGWLLHCTPSRGMARCIAAGDVMPPLDDAATLIVERVADESVWAALPAAPGDAVRERLWRGLRRAFDPAGILNPGIQTWARG
jgi:glycolate oxidase FAD binding subunit